jgi:predicted peptidase
MVQVKRPNLTIGTYLKGLLEYTPPGYNPAGTTLYPVMIYFHGVGEIGSGSSTDLCKILSLNAPDNNANNPFDIPLPERIERGELPTITYNGGPHPFIVLSPQYNQYSFPGNYPSAPDVSAMIDYALANYKIDPERIYLVGMSSGSNMIIEYAAASQANAERVAAIAMASLCSSVGNNPNGPANIAAADLPVWEVHCTNDNNPFCPDSISTNWINAINAQSPPPTPLAKKTTLPISGWPCINGNEHNTWNTLFDPAFTVDGVNVYNWLAQYSRNESLPADIVNYTASLRSGKVYVEWTTTAESNTRYFVLERANAAMQYQEIGRVGAAGVSSQTKKYVLIDDQPQRGANLYRLVLVNLDGKKEYYDIKRVSLPNSSGAGVVNIPNPVKGTLSVYVNVEQSQQVRILVHDLNGKTVQRSSRLFTPGVSENKIDVTSLPTGTYFIKVEGETFSVTKKVLIN